jgi:hypothetical protein
MTERLEEFLLARGAASIEHPGGMLLDHLRRTSEQLRDWGADEDLQAVGLAHATYGTDGLDAGLLDPADPADRAELVSIVGPDVEAQVHLYASCDRRATYPRLADRPDVLFADRFTGQSRPLPADDLRRFAELTAANELDVAAHAPGFTSAYGAWLAGLLQTLGPLLSPAARAAAHHYRDDAAG